MLLVPRRRWWLWLLVWSVSTATGHLPYLGSFDQQCYLCPQQVSTQVNVDSPAYRRKPRDNNTPWNGTRFTSQGTAGRCLGHWPEQPSRQKVSWKVRFVIAEPDKTSWEQFQERGLECPIDHKLFIDPMKTPLRPTLPQRQQLPSQPQQQHQQPQQRQTPTPTARAGRPPSNKAARPASGQFENLLTKQKHELVALQLVLGHGQRNQQELSGTQAMCSVWWRRRRRRRRSRKRSMTSLSVPPPCLPTIRCQDLRCLY